MTVYEISSTPHVAWGFIFGVLPLAIAFVLAFSKFRFKWDRPSWLSIALCAGAGIFWLVTGGFPGLNSDPDELALYRQGRYETVEGLVTDFVPEHWSGHALESFSVREIRFCYAENFVDPGFRNDHAHGGPIREGQHVRIAYVPSEYLPKHNTILRLEVARNQIPIRKWF